KVKVAESRLTDSGPDYYDTTNNTMAPSIVGSLKGIGDPPATATAGSDLSPSAVRDFYWQGGTLTGSGSLGLLWSTPRGVWNDTAAAYGIADAVMDFNPAQNSFKSVANGINSTWWADRTGTYKGTGTLPAGSNTGV